MDGLPNTDSPRFQPAAKPATSPLTPSRARAPVSTDELTPAFAERRGLRLSGRRAASTETRGAEACPSPAQTWGRGPWAGTEYRPGLRGTLPAGLEDHADGLHQACWAPEMACVVPGAALQCRLPSRENAWVWPCSEANPCEQHNSCCGKVHFHQRPCVSINAPRSPVPTVIQAPRPRLASQAVKEGAVSLPGTCGQNCPSKPLPRGALLVFQNIAEPRIWGPGVMLSRA